MSFRSNQTLSGLLNLLPTIQYAFWFYFLFFVLFPHFDQLKCVVCVYVVCCVKRLMQAFHMSMQSWSYTVLSLHHEYQTFPLAAPPAIIFFPPGAIWRMPPRAYAGVFWCNKTGSALSLLSWRQIHNFFSSQLETFLVIGDSGLQEFWQQPFTSLPEHYVLTHN